MGNSITGKDREFVWTFLADVFTGSELNKDGLSRLRRFPIEEVKTIFFSEISPVCAFNLTITTPEIDGFDPRWVKNEISRMITAKNASLVGRVAYESKAMFCRCISRSVWQSVRKSIEA